MRRNLRVVGGSPWFFFGATSLAMPFLLFSTFLPTWSPIAAIVLLTVASLLRCYATGRVLGHTPADWALLLVLLTLPVSLWASADHHTTLPRVYAYIANLGVFWAIAGLARTSSYLGRVTRWLVAGGVALGLVLLLGTTASGGKLPFINREIYGLLPRGVRPFWNLEGFNSNLVGGMIALFWPLALALVLQTRTLLGRLAALSSAAILAGLLLLTQSRGALIGVILAAPIVTALSHRRWLWLWAMVAMAAAVGLASGHAQISPEILFGTSDVLGVSSLPGRVELWSRALYMIQDFPFTGVGLGMFEPVVKLLYPTFSIGPDSVFLHAHNIYLNTAAEMGLLGLIGHLSFYITLTAMLLIRVFKTHTEPQRTLAIGLLGALIVFLTHGLFEVITTATRAAIIVWALFGLMAAVGMGPLTKDEKDL